MEIYYKDETYSIGLIEAREHGINKFELFLHRDEYNVRIGEFVCQNNEIMMKNKAIEKIENTIQKKNPVVKKDKVKTYKELFVDYRKNNRGMSAEEIEDYIEDVHGIRKL